MSTPDSATDAPLPSSRPWHTWAFVALICVACFAVYQHGLGGQFTNWDDNWLITENRHIRGLSWQNIQTMFNPMAPREELGNEYLPIRDLSYAVNYALDGLNARGYQATNLLLHVFNSLLVMLLAGRLTGRRLIGGLAGLVFAVHPVHVEAVSWLSSRKDLLATFFLLASVHFYLAARRPREGLMPSESFIRRVRHSARLAYSLSVLMFVLALLSKMPAVVLPALLVLLELFFLKAGTSPGRSGVRRFVPTLPFWGVALLFTLLAMKIGTGLMREPYGDGRFQSTLTAVSAIARDFQVLFIGWPMQAAVDMPVQTGISLGVAAGTLILVALLGIGFTGWKAGAKDGRWALLAGVAGFGALWFLVALAPVSNLAVQIGTVFAERYLYIPSIGFAVAVAAAAAIAAERLRGPARFAPLAVLLAACGMWSWQTTQAVKPWRNSTLLWAHVLELDPENHTAWFNAGREKQDQALLEADDARRAELFDGAMADYSQALNFPARTYRFDQARVSIAMASVCLQRERPSDAMKLLVSAAEDVEQPWRSRANPAHADRVADIEAILANYRGLAQSALGRHDQSVAAFEEAVAKSTRYASARINLAAELSRAALAANPVNEDTLNRAKRELAQYEQTRGRDEASIEQRARMTYAEFSRRLELSGKGAEAAIPADLAPLLEESRKLYSELVTLRDAGGMSRRARARTLVEAAEVMARGRAGDPTAEAYFRKALELDPQFVGLRTLLARFLFEKTENRAQATREANKLLADELQQTPAHKPALQLKAAGLRQAAVDQAHALRQRWLPLFKTVHKEDNPTWQGLITAFYRGNSPLKDPREFTDGLLTVVALLRQAIEADPENTEGHALIEGTGLPMALGMWFTRVPGLRGNAEDLLRTAFNARPEDGHLANVLAQFYFELAEEVINPRSGANPEQKDTREALNELLTNMLTLSEKARNLLSGKLFNVGRDVEDGVKKVTGEDGQVLELSEMARKTTAAEFMRAATMLNAENVPALDWLKNYYEKEGNLEEAVRIFQQIVNTLKDRPKLMHGVNLMLAQLQANLGHQMFRAFHKKIELQLTEEAAGLRDKAVVAYKQCLATTALVLQNPDDPDKISMPLRLRGIAAQRLATLLLGEAEKYLTIALETYMRMPGDFPTEIYEVRRKRVIHIRDPYQKVRELRAVLENPPAGTDTSLVEADIRDFERLIARREADAMRRDGKLAEALARIEQVMNAPTPMLYGARGNLYLDMAGRAAGEEAAGLKRKAAADLGRATTEPEDLLRAGRLYWEDEALMLEPGRVPAARAALIGARDLLESRLLDLLPDDPVYKAAVQVQKQVMELLGQITSLGSERLKAARKAWEAGELGRGLPLAEEAAEMLGDIPQAWQVLARIRRDIGRKARKAGDANAARWFEDARSAFEAALLLNIALASTRLEIEFELAEMLFVDLNDSKAALNRIYFGRQALKDAPEEVRPALEKTWEPRFAELARKAGGR